MKKIPYHGNPGNACALACYTMTAQYLLPDKNLTFEKLAKIAHWRKGYVVWAFRVWEYLMDLGVHITDYDSIDYEAWITGGVKGLQASLPDQEFEYIRKNTYDLEEEGKLAKLALHHPNFTYILKKPTWEDVVKEFNKPGICELSLNSRQLNRCKGFALHRVVLIDITDKEVVIHDPNEDGSGSYRREPLEFFREVFETPEAPEICHYSLSV